eukprot:gene40889-50590_t
MANSAIVENGAAPRELSLGIEGMSCASCVGRVEKAIKKWQFGMHLPVRGAQHTKAWGVLHQAATNEVAATDSDGAGIK